MFEVAAMTAAIAHTTKSRPTARATESRPTLKLRTYDELASRRLGDEIPEPAPTFADEGYAADPDVQRMLAVQRGDLKAFEEIVAGNQERVYAIVFRFVRNRDAAEDLSQQVFLRVFRSAARYTPQARFVTWLYRICVNTALNYIRNYNRRKCASACGLHDADSEPLPVADDSVRAPWLELAREEMETRVWQAVETLPERQKAALILRTDGMAYEDIAEALSMSVVALKSLLARARVRLKELLEPMLAP
jgi:RNA polymerase sigma-70 factor (ECF subfamily)